MTFEEFKRQRARIEETKKDIPAIYNDVLSVYQHCQLQYASNRVKLDSLYYDMENVKGIDYTKQRNAYNQDAHIERYYNISDRIKDLEKENTMIENCMKGLEYIRDNITDAILRTKVTACYFNDLIG